MKILVIGAGGREHALIHTLRRTAAAADTSSELEIFCANGNAGIAEEAQLIEIVPTNVRSLADFAATQKIDLTIVGGEAPLAHGMTDEFRKRGLLIAAPTRAAAQLESSKAFAKDFMLRYKIPTARFRVVKSYAQAREVLQRGEFGDSATPVVVKADGLAAGKGVFVTNSHAEALRAAEELFDSAKNTKSDAKAAVILEETLTGAECSLLLWTDGRDYRLMPAARDHKRVGEGDTGANTGGMGAVTSDDILGNSQLAAIIKEIVEPTLEGIRGDNLDFRGVLFIGLMLTAEGARVLEFNTRFGDPEAQALLVKLETDLSRIFEAVAQKRLGEIAVKWNSQASACVVLAARGYPEAPKTGAIINGLEIVAAKTKTAAAEVKVFHAATKRRGEQWIVNGGRVLGVTATGEKLDDALVKCYETINHISWDGMFYRRDIGKTTSKLSRTI